LIKDNLLTNFFVFYRRNGIEIMRGHVGCEK